MKNPRKMQDVPKRLRNTHQALACGAPEMLTDSDFAYAAAVRDSVRSPRKPAKPEWHAQRAVVTYLRKHLPAGSIVFAITNHSRSRMQSFALTAMGMLPGMPDLCVITPNAYSSVPLLLCIEMKAPDGRVSDVQLHTQQTLRALGVPVLAKCTSTQEAVEWLRKQGVQIDG